MGETVRYRTVFGALQEIPLVEQGEFVTPGSALEQQLVLVHGQTYVRKFVSLAAGRRNPNLYTLLDNEVRVGARLAQVFAHRFPPELAGVVAYNMDVEEPFALLRGYTGEPAVGVVSRFDDQQRRLFAIGLLRALHQTAAAGVVHGAVSLDVLRWDGRTVQLVDFEAADRVGGPRRAGGGTIDVRDDLWAAGQVIRRLYLGGMVDGTWPNRAHDPGLLRALLDPIFNAPQQNWPHAADLLRILRADPPMLPVTDPETVLAAGHQLFDQVSHGKRGANGFAQETPALTRTGRRGRRMFTFLAVTVLVAALLAETAVR